ncbi:MAG: hypothetical protein UU08_C0001G0020 [Candidatus Uhrbacteria bacterium GW2011_GWE2_40_58]|nr:MAG: hypothetical protein UT94_C0001G0020 [Candidatus Uhrbacteria bacterium GW2011_GWF2_40_263]KKR68246.1 MAG: hypothetical protein UU08_C0001G0020 [Candidatus Uhrbacteria bacterium GW2011_GWE2_40_58]OGL92049.1 MAG: hypothetical protein A2239_03485 [Candidatus Uhrbacteria bacterium RIFOXYA2_FULL_40_9]OGL97507.1 MAG: hypothetical protein A2332_00190 [Candidatus Uhrbacteria bacterium RIFOXYB2_FULL_41_18]HBK35106.1 hypothetical protein [Candidatus Uhrbacteria bacterium]
MKRFLLILLGGSLLLLLGGWLSRSYFYSQEQTDLPVSLKFEEVVKVEEEEKNILIVEETPVVEENVILEIEKDEEANERIETLPLSINLAVPFTPQAPSANWDMPYQEACEEASILMVHAYYQGEEEGLLEASFVETELLNMVAFEENQLGFSPDMDAQQADEFIKAWYGYTKVELLFDPTIEEIKEHLVSGRPVIVPAMGQQLGNPFFTAPGPRYHMLVLRGYTSEGFITNDPGTKRGKAYLYSFEVIMNALHDWNEGAIETGQKVIIVIYPNL